MPIQLNEENDGKILVVHVSGKLAKADYGKILVEYRGVSRIFRACAESLASENASRLAAMQRADKSIDEELFDVISGFEALSTKN